MNALLSQSPELPYSGRPPVLLAATSARALASARRTADAAGMRIAAGLPIAEARERLDRQASLSALWAEIDEDVGLPLDEFLKSIARDASAGRYSVVVSTTADLIDAVMAGIDENDVDVLVDPSDADRAAALAVAAAKPLRPLTLSDAASDRNAESLRQLSDEVSRIASTLARLSSTPPAIRAIASPAGDSPEISAKTVRQVIQARRMRDRYFSSDLFADPAWDMMLDLLQAEIAQLRVPVSSLCIASAVPATTALRWLKTLVGEGLFVRRSDPHDGRRIFVELAPTTSHALRTYFAEVSAAVI